MRASTSMVKSSLGRSFRVRPRAMRSPSHKIPALSVRRTVTEKLSSIGQQTSNIRPRAVQAIISLVCAGTDIFVTSGVLFCQKRAKTEGCAKLTTETRRHGGPKEVTGLGRVGGMSILGAPRPYHPVHAVKRARP